MILWHKKKRGIWPEIKFREPNLESFSPGCCDPKAAFDWTWVSPWSQWICISFTWFNQLSWSSKVESIVNSIFSLFTGLIVQGKTVWNLQAEAVNSRACESKQTEQCQVLYLLIVSLLQQELYPSDQTVLSILLDGDQQRKQLKFLPENSS